MDPGCNSNGYDENQPSYSGGAQLYEEAVLNGVRNRRKVSELPSCPVCCCTLRHQELGAHLLREIDNLNKITMPAHKRKTSTPTSGGSGEGGGGEQTGGDAPACEVYERVRRNRERRLRAVSRRAQASCSTGASGASVVCPVCGRRVPAPTAEAHVDSCLRNEDRTVDVENDVESVGGSSPVAGEEDGGRGFGAWYSWGTEERVRAGALQLREGGALPSGALVVRRASTDTTLVVDGDEDEVLYGPPQYSPERIAPTEEMVLSSQDMPVYEEQAPHVTDDETLPHKEEVSYSQESLVGALKDRIRELERKTNDVKCLICMGGYSEPVVSVQCWHVYCETCWLESLRAKKTCPQCNAITTAAHLRRIYI